MIIHTYEKGERGRACDEFARKSAWLTRYREVFILPIPTTRDGILLKDTDITLSETVGRVEKGDLVICYGLADRFKEEIRGRGADVYDAGSDEGFLEANAHLTAICTLGVLLTTEQRAPEDLNFGIVGYGRIGKSLARLLLFLGADVAVYTTREKTRLELCECGIKAYASGAGVRGIDILINTAPAVIFSTESEGISEARIIDLASGNNFPGITGVEAYPSIPAKMFPKTAGRLLLDCAERWLGI